MVKSVCRFGIYAALAALLWVGVDASQNTVSPTTPLMGTVTSSDGKPLEGIAVSARAQGKTFTTSVYTNARGEYFFPPLDDGQYRIWAQAVGFELVRSEQAVSSSKRTQQDFNLKPLADFHKQLSGAELMESLPDATPEDRRMRMVFANTCGGCHMPGYVLQLRFDAAGWETIVNYMADRVKGNIVAPGGRQPVLNAQGEQMGPARQLLEFYKQDMVAYLTRVRGPTPLPGTYKPFPRPTGEATAAVVTEYDLPFDDETDRYGNYEYRNGSDWSRGIRTFGETLVHDVMYSTKDGHVYFSNSPTPGRTVGKLDPKTGRVTSLQIPGRQGSSEEGLAAGSQYGNVDRHGDVWLVSYSGKALIKFDPSKQTFQRFPASLSWNLYGGGAADSKGNVWNTTDTGATRLNPGTGEFTEFKAPSTGGRPYDLEVDAEGNAWFPMMAVDRMGVVDARTGQVSEVALPPLEDADISVADRVIGQRSGAWTDSAPIFQKGPRRLGTDPNGDTVWFGEFWSGKLGKIDIHTKKVTEYDIPGGRFAKPYKVGVDKNHVVWFGMANADRLGKFNPMTQQFTMYQLPTRGTNSRSIYVDNSSNVPVVWVAYQDANKIARVQFRTTPAR